EREPEAERGRAETEQLVRAANAVAEVEAGEQERVARRRVLNERLADVRGEKVDAGLVDDAADLQHRAPLPQPEDLLADLERGLAFVGARPVKRDAAGGHELALDEDEVEIARLQPESAESHRADSVSLELVRRRLLDVVFHAARDAQVRMESE